MNVCKCIVPLRYGGILNSHRVVSPLVRLMERDERLETLDHFQNVLAQNWDGSDRNRNVICMGLNATANDWYTSYPCTAVYFVGSDQTSSHRCSMYGTGCSGDSLKTGHAVDEEDAAKIDELLEVVGAVYAKGIGGRDSDDNVTVTRCGKK
ncbi:hypothetical protein TNCV_2751421 [Trichonephila clavipes]|nr:hypothetical protein TNCV_2751421 [Trichonephila clavipes]